MLTRLKTRKVVERLPSVPETRGFFQICNLTQPYFCKHQLGQRQICMYIYIHVFTINFKWRPCLHVFSPAFFFEHFPDSWNDRPFSRDVFGISDYEGNQWQKWKFCHQHRRQRILRWLSAETLQICGTQEIHWSLAGNIIKSWQYIHITSKECLLALSRS